MTRHSAEFVWSWPRCKVGGVCGLLGVVTGGRASLGVGTKTLTETHTLQRQCGFNEKLPLKVGSRLWSHYHRGVGGGSAGVEGWIRAGAGITDWRPPIQPHPPRPRTHSCIAPSQPPLHFLLVLTPLPRPTYVLYCFLRWLRAS